MFCGFEAVEEGMASPSLGVLGSFFCRLPGIGGRSNGAGDCMFDMVGSLEVEMIYEMTFC